MITNPEPVNFPICFKHKGGMIYGYLDNGFCLVASPSSPMVMLNDYHNTYSTFEMYESYISGLKTSRTHELISNENFDNILQNTVDSIFSIHLDESTEKFNKITLASVKKKRREDFGFYKND